MLIVSTDRNINILFSFKLRFSIPIFQIFYWYFLGMLFDFFYHVQYHSYLRHCCVSEKTESLINSGVSKMRPLTERSFNILNKYSKMNHR